jgi:hypothetical protein
MGKDKKRGQAKGKKLTVKKEAATKDLAPKRDVRAGAGADDREPWTRLSANHNETFVLDAARKRKAK